MSVGMEAGIMENLQVSGTKRMARYLATQILVTTDAHMLSAYVNALNEFAKITQGRPLYPSNEAIAFKMKVTNYRIKHWAYTNGNGNGAIVDVQPLADAFLRYFDFYGERCI